MNEATQLKPNNTVASPPQAVLLDCKCGYPAGEIMYCGGRSGKYIINCTNTKCPAMVTVTGNKGDTAFAWNKMQGAI